MCHAMSYERYTDTHKSDSLEPVVMSTSPQYGTAGTVRPPGATGTRWSALLTWELGTAPYGAGPEGERHA